MERQNVPQDSQFLRRLTTFALHSSVSHGQSYLGTITDISEGQFSWSYCSKMGENSAYRNDDIGKIKETCAFTQETKFNFSV